MNQSYNIYYDSNVNRVILKKPNDNNINYINDNNMNQNINNNQNMNQNINNNHNMNHNMNQNINNNHNMNQNKESFEKKISHFKINLEDPKIDNKINDRDLYNSLSNYKNEYIINNILKNMSNSKDNTKNIRNYNLEKKENTDQIDQIIQKDHFHQKNQLNQTYINNLNKLNHHSLKELFYGIKKTILSDLNYLNHSCNSSDFKIKLNNQNIYDTFYLFPNISEINTKNETNFINEKKIIKLINKNDMHDIQYFPLEYIPIGINILLNKNKYTKLLIKDIYWNIFQTIDKKYYKNNEILSISAAKNEFIYIPTKLKINFELHSQLPPIINEIPYYDPNIKNYHSGNTCLYKVSYIEMNELNGKSNHNIEINLNSKIDITCALLCIKISVPDECIQIMLGKDKNDNDFYGYIPFSQLVVNFNYELL